MPVTQYTARSREFLALGIGAFFLVLALVIAYLLWRAWRNSAAQRRKEKAIEMLCVRQQNAIAWCIQEIESQLVVPDGLSSELIAIHEMYPRVMKGNASEIL